MLWGSHHCGEHTYIVGDEELLEMFITSMKEDARDRHLVERAIQSLIGVIVNDEGGDETVE